LDFGWPGQPAKLSEHTYWEIDFPEWGDEDPGANSQKVLDDFEAVLIRSVERRLRADVPVVSYLSGGVDSSLIVALAGHVRKQPIPTFTIQVKSPRFDERSEAELVARHVGAEQTVIGCSPDEVMKTYPRVIRAAEGPVIDTSCAATILLAQGVHAHGYKVALCGEGSDEWLAGYPWYKVFKLFELFNFMPGLFEMVRRGYLWYAGGSQPPLAFRKRMEDAGAGPNGWTDMQALAGMSQYRLFSPGMRELALEHIPYEDLGLNLNRARRWHPLNRALYIGARTMLPGLLLNAKGDRSAMNSSVETRYPFLDEEVFSFLARLHPRWKMPGFRDKYVLRRIAQRWLPKRIAWRSKWMFRAPLDSFHLNQVPPFVNQLLSRESLRKAGYFDPEAVTHWRTAFRDLRLRSYERTSMEMGLVGVVSTQLWHHTFIDSSLADLPSLASKAKPEPKVPKVQFATEGKGNVLEAISH
jgi:asparagine synthase (glutamine-hydrolysing)